MAQNINKDSDEDNFVCYKFKRQINRREIQNILKRKFEHFFLLVDILMPII